MTVQLREFHEQCSRSLAWEDPAQSKMKLKSIHKQLQKITTRGGGGEEGGSMHIDTTVTGDHIQPYYSKL